MGPPPKPKINPRPEACFERPEAGKASMPSFPLFASTSRRRFLYASSAAALAASLPGWKPRASAQPSGANSRVRVAVMGLNGRGMDHVRAFLALPNVEITAVCDVDERAMTKASALVEKSRGTAPAAIKDIRQLVESKAIDALSIAAPNHWHAPATLLACAAGKHVYVEKPCSHTPREGELMVRAARKFHRKVQMGNQRRSWTGLREAIAELHGGAIGKVTFARTWYNNQRPSIGRGKAVPVPAWLDYDLWQGPVEERPFRDNVVHYNWHWFWHWGNGELGNNGIHALDVARWGLRAGCPRQVTCGGGRYQFDDDQETPDIYVTTFELEGQGASWESHSHHGRGFEGSGFGITFYGDRGTFVISGNSMKFYDLNNKLTRELPHRGNDLDHYGNFVEAIRNDVPLHSEIEEGVLSTLWCHLGNIAWRTRQTLQLDPARQQLKNNDAARKLWASGYRKGWRDLEKIA